MNPTYPSTFFSERNFFPAYDAQTTQKQTYKPPSKRTYMEKTTATSQILRKSVPTIRGKIMIFIDGSNLFYTAGMMNMEIDYLKLVEALLDMKHPDEKTQLVRVYFYTGVDPQSDAHCNWEKFMRMTGFKMVTKNLQTFPDGTRKANCDVEMTVDMISLIGTYDTAILISGDGDLTRAVEYMVDKGVQVHVCGHKSNTNEGLIRSADRFIDLESLKTQILLARPSHNKPPSPPNERNELDEIFSN